MNTRRSPLIMVAPFVTRGDEHPGGQLTAAAHLRRELRARNIPVVEVSTFEPSFPPPKLFSKALRAAVRVARILGYCCFRRPSGVVIFTNSGVGLLEKALVALLARALGVRSVLALRDSRLIALAVGGNFAAALVCRAISLSASVLVVQSRRAADQLNSIQVAKSRVCVIANAAPTVPLLFRSMHSGVRFLFVGWLIAEKGLRELVDAFEIVKRTHAESTLTVVGGGPMEAFVHERSMGSSLRLVGWASRSRLSAIYAKCDVLVLPSYSEGFPNVLLEAMAHADAMASLCDSPVLLAAMKKAGRHHARTTFAPERNAVAFHSLLDGTHGT